MEFSAPSVPRAVPVSPRSARKPGGAPGPSPAHLPAHLPGLLRGTPRQVLARLVPGDPLDLRALAAAGLRRRALLLDTDALLARLQARVARAARQWEGRPGLSAWLLERVDESLDDLLDESLGSRIPQTPAPGSALALLAAPLGLSARGMAAGCSRFNALDDATRQAFFTLVLEREGLESGSARLGVAPVELARRARRGLEAFRPQSGDAGGRR